jgi:hypothetical protein
MEGIIISINQAAEFLTATDSKKRQIIKQQKTPDPFMVNHYQLARGRLKKSVQQGFDLKPILDRIEELRKRPVKNKSQEGKKQASIEALTRFTQMQIPKIMQGLSFEVIRPSSKYLAVRGVTVIISPDIVFRTKVDGHYVLGAVKFHISKNSLFDHKQCGIVASAIDAYLRSEVATDSDIVSPELCLCVDIFSNRIISASSADPMSMDDIASICGEVKALWDAA